MFRLVTLLTLAALASAEIVHPCASDPTRECYANHIASISGCIPPTELPTTDVWQVRPATIEMGFFRGTIVRHTTTVEGISNVENFILFYDTDRNYTVLSYNFPSVLVYGTEQIQYHTPGEVDAVIETSFRTTYKNINITVQWKGVEQIRFGTGENKLYSYIDSSAYDFETDFPELAAVIAADPEGIAARVHQLTLENPAVALREQESPVGSQIVRPFWNNYLCTNLP